MKLESFVRAKSPHITRRNSRNGKNYQVARTRHVALAPLELGINCNSGA